MSDAFVPEADRIDQNREVVPSQTDDDTETAPAGRPAGKPVEASEADVWEQMQEVDDAGEDDYA